jgi:hypothetical protein
MIVMCKPLIKRMLMIQWTGWDYISCDKGVQLP